MIRLIWIDSPLWCKTRFYTQDLNHVLNYWPRGGQGTPRVWASVWCKWQYCVSLMTSRRKITRKWYRTNKTLEMIHTNKMWPKQLQVFQNDQRKVVILSQRHKGQWKTHTKWSTRHKYWPKCDKKWQQDDQKSITNYAITTLIVVLCPLFCWKAVLPFTCLRVERHIFF